MRELLWAARSLARRRGFSLLAIATLALGIGANVAIFSVLHATLLKPLPYRDPDRLVLLWNRFESSGSEKVPIAIPEVSRFEERSRLFEGFATATRIADAMLTGQGEAQHVQLGRAWTQIRGLPGQSLVAESISAQRFALPMTALFAAVSLLLAAVGLYGVIAYSTGRRTQEIGLRFVLGARRADVLRQVLAQGLRVTLIGLVVGLAGAAGLSLVIRSLLFGVGGLDPITYADVVGVLGTVSVLATWLPAHRANRLDPGEALRRE